MEIRTSWYKIIVFTLITFTYVINETNSEVRDSDCTWTKCKIMQLNLK